MIEHRGYKIQPTNNLIGYEIRHTGKGSLAKSLSGSFTSYHIAKTAIDTYLNSKEEKEEIDGSDDSSSGSEPVQRRANYRRKPSNDS
jgi:hypothetical protein